MGHNTNIVLELKKIVHERYLNFQSLSSGSTCWPGFVNNLFTSVLPAHVSALSNLIYCFYTCIDLKRVDNL